MTGEDQIRQALDGAEEIPSLAPTKRGAGSLDGECARYLRNDYGNGQRLIARYGEKLLHIKNRKEGWFAWDGKHWNNDEGEDLARKWANETHRAIMDEVRVKESADDGVDETWVKAHRRFAVESGNRGRILAMMDSAAVYLRRHSDDMDSNPWLLNVENGTLRLGGNDPGRNPEVVLGAFDPEDLISKIAPVRYDSDADCPVFRAFLEKILPDSDIQTFLQTWFGYSMTGDTSEQFIIILQGLGSNGKSTLLNVMERVLGDYVARVPFGTFSHDKGRRGGDATPDLVRLPGARMLIAGESDAGARFSEGMIKQMTGGEKMTVRALNQGFFDFVPQFKVSIAVNPKPQIYGQDDGIWRRVRMVPFREKVSRADVELVYDALEREVSGILNWLLDGYRIWAERGLKAPPAVESATEQYREESDPIGDFLEECCVRGEGYFVLFKNLWEEYLAWCEEAHVKPLSRKRLGKLLQEGGFEPNEGGDRKYFGLDLKTHHRDDWDGRTKPPADHDDLGGV